MRYTHCLIAFQNRGSHEHLAVCKGDLLLAFKKFINLVGKDDTLLQFTFLQ